MWSVELEMIKNSVMFPIFTLNITGFYKHYKLYLYYMGVIVKSEVPDKFKVI